jgi:hypothetical protein
MLGEFEEGSVFGAAQNLSAAPSRFAGACTDETATSNRHRGCLGDAEAQGHN